MRRWDETSQELRAWAGIVRRHLGSSVSLYMHTSLMSRVNSRLFWKYCWFVLCGSSNLRPALLHRSIKWCMSVLSLSAVGPSYLLSNIKSLYEPILICVSVFMSTFIWTQFFHAKFEFLLAVKRGCKHSDIVTIYDYMTSLVNSHLLILELIPSDWMIWCFPNRFLVLRSWGEMLFGLSIVFRGPKNRPAL